jgi:hypothetical protein
MRRLSLLALILLTACGGTAGVTTISESSLLTTVSPTADTDEAPEPTDSVTFPSVPEVNQGPLDATTQSGLDALLAEVFTPDFDATHLDTVIEGGDVRAAWVLADLLRFYQTGASRDELVYAFTRLTGVASDPDQTDFVWASNALIAWDLPSWDGYADIKRYMYSSLDPRWTQLFEDDASMDWRFVTWGGVAIDDRPFGDNGPCNCIPALDDPATTDAAGGDWYADDKVVFGVVVNEEAIALPRHQMEVHEMVNLTLGRQALGIPYCTLCGSAQAYLTADVSEDRVVLRTSGLLVRSNKVMYDVNTGSILDTFTGEAMTGPLAVQGLVLQQVTVVASKWGDWKQAHPETRILAQDGGIGRAYLDDPLGDRDANGPIFPVGDVDVRLDVQELVVGVITPEGIPVAFPVSASIKALKSGETVEVSGVVAGFTDGLRVYDKAGAELPTHQSFWFAWSQFHPETLLWVDAQD